MQPIEIQSTFTISGCDKSIEGISKFIRKYWLRNGSRSDSCLVETKGATDIVLHGYSSFRPEDEKHFRKVLAKLSSWGGSVSWHYYSNEQGPTTGLEKFINGQSRCEFRSDEHLFMEAETVRNVILARSDDLDAAKRLSEEMVRIAEDMEQSGESDPYPAANMLSILSVLREIDYRPDPEHVKRWGTLLAVCQGLDFGWGDLDWAEDVIDWLEHVYPACEMALVAFHEMEGEFATCFPD